MSITTSEAAQSLHEAEITGRRMRAADAYSAASGYLILWGAIWFLGYAGCGLVAPVYWAAVWVPLILVGGVASAVLGHRGTGRRDPVRGERAATLIMSAAIAVFIVSVLAVFRPAEPEPSLMLPALVTGLVYMLMGSLVLRRFVWIGAAIFVVALAGYFLARPMLPFLLALAGGGGLVLGGLWLRRP